MLLQRLTDYADRLDLPPTLYSEGPVRYLIELDADGNLLSPEPVDTADPANPRTKRGQRRLLPQVQRAASVKPLLLADKATYVLGYVGEGGRPERVGECHRSFLDLLGRCVEETEEPSVRAVFDFLAADPLSVLQLPADFDPGGIITFRVAGVFPIDLPSVQSFWAAEHDPARAEGGVVMQCLVCGQERPVLSRLQAKIKGVPGGQSSGTSLISANAEAFESYGLEASLIAPTCASCGERFTKGLNNLLQGEATHLRVGDSVFAFWTRRPEATFSFRTLLTEPTADEVKSLLASVRSGRAQPEVQDDRFYATSLTASGGRTVVRDWMDCTVGEAQVNLARWFGLQEIVGGGGEEPEPLSLFKLAMGTAREQKNLSPTVPLSLLHAAFTGTPVPVGLLFQAVRRNRAEQGVTRPRTALIKLVLRSHSHEEEDRMVCLDTESTSPGYHCGRLLAVLEEAQKLAIPGISATIVDRFFGTASSAPASVFGRLLRGAQPHLSKLERDRRPTGLAIQKRLEEVLSHLAAFPKTLNLQEQGLFALGYYHQRAASRSQARERAEAKKSEHLSPESTDTE